MRFWQLSGKLNLIDFFRHSCCGITLPPTLLLSPHDILSEKKFEKIIEINGKKFRKKMVLIKTGYEEGRLQPTPAGHPPAGHMGGHHIEN
jgi:hypothetical protein